MEWFFPENVEEAAQCVQEEGVVPHGGGTMLCRGNLSRIRGMVDLSRTGLSGLRRKGDTFSIGATTTFSEVARDLKACGAAPVLSHALGIAAAKPLRNRITIGGSIASFPLWSDLMGPLLALGSSVHLRGRVTKIVSLEDYATTPDLRRGTLITACSFLDRSWRFWYHREVRVRFDYPAFTLTLLALVEEECVKELRAVLVGCRNRFSRMVEIEEALRGFSLGRELPRGLGRQFDAEFSERPHGSGAYLREIAGVWVERGLGLLLGKDKDH